MAQQQTYKKALISALDCLNEAEGHMMSAVLNIALSGKYKELGRLYEVGEIFEAEPAMFEDTGDPNVDLILQIVKKLNNAIESIKNLNALDDDD